MLLLPSEDATFLCSTTVLAHMPQFFCWCLCKKPHLSQRLGAAAVFAAAVCGSRSDDVSTSSSKAPAKTASSRSTKPQQQQQPQQQEESDNILLKALASESDSEDEGSRSTGAAGWAATLGVVAGISILMGGGYLFRGQIKHFLDFFIQAVDDWGIWGYLAYAAVYAGLEVLAVPAIPLTMTAGAIFGPVPGTIIVSVSATVAATIAFLIARYAARDKVRVVGRRVGVGTAGWCWVQL